MLKALYNQFEDVQYRGLTGENLYKALEEYERDDVAYVAERIDGKHVDVQGALGKRISTIQITATGIEKLHEDGYDTILDGDIRYDILEQLYQLGWENTEMVFSGRDDLVDDLNNEAVVDQTIWYQGEAAHRDARRWWRPVLPRRQNHRPGR